MSAPSQLSFLPEDYLERKAQRRSIVICAWVYDGPLFAQVVEVTANSNVFVSECGICSRQ